MALQVNPAFKTAWTHKIPARPVAPITAIDPDISDFRQGEFPEANVFVYSIKNSLLMNLFKFYF